MWDEDNKKKTAGIFVVILFIFACFGPFIDIFRYVDFCQHKDKVIIESTICEGLTQADDGNDYLNFSIDVFFEKYEVKSFKAHTLVFKGEEFVGHIKSEFSGTSSHYENNNTEKYFEADSKQTLDFHISHTRGDSWDGHSLFKELCYGDIEEFTFVTNVTLVYFCDGTTVGRSLDGIRDYYYDEKGQIHYKEDS